MELYQQINQYVNEKNNEKVIELTEQYLNTIDTTQNPTKETEQIFTFYVNAVASKDSHEKITEMFTKIYGKDRICSHDATIMYTNALIICEKIELATTFILNHIIKTSTLEDPSYKQTNERLFEMLKAIKLDNSHLSQIIENVNKLLDETLLLDTLSEEIKQKLLEVKEFTVDEEDEEEEENENENKEIILTQSTETTEQITYNIDVDQITNEELPNESNEIENEKKEEKQTILESIVDTVVSNVSSFAEKVTETYENMSTNQRIGAGLTLTAVAGVIGFGIFKLVKAIKK